MWPFSYTQNILYPYLHCHLYSCKISFLRIFCWLLPFGISSLSHEVLKSFSQHFHLFIVVIFVWWCWVICIMNVSFQSSRLLNCGIFFIIYTFRQVIRVPMSSLTVRGLIVCVSRRDVFMLFHSLVRPRKILFTLSLEGRSTLDMLDHWWYQ